MKMWKFRVRVIVGIMIFLGYFLLYLVRYDLSVHIVEMAKMPVSAMNNNNTLHKVTTTHYTRAGGIIDLFFWNDMRVARLFSAYHIGYCICFPIFHNVGDRLGPTWVVGIAGLTSGCLNCITPLSVYSGVWALFVVRMVLGFCAGAMQPSMVQVLRYWVPPFERNHFMWAYCGITIGTCSTFMICAIVHYYSRWPVGFYMSGVLQVVWAMAWLCIVTDCPSKHRWIPRDELEYLNETIGNIFTITVTNVQAPWCRILKSVPFWALCALNFGYSWMIIALCLHGPLYYSIVVKYSIYKASALTALPFFLRLVLGTIIIQTFHYYSHNVRLRRINHIRKFMVVFSHVIPGALVTVTWLTPLVPGPILLTVAVAMTAAGMDMTLDICYELSPTFFSTINTVIRMIGNSSGIFVSFGVGIITNKYHNYSYVWKHIWCFHALVLLLSGLIFLIWGETQLQPWNSLRQEHLLRERKLRPKPKASIMSNITEIDEEEFQSKKNSSLKIQPKINLEILDRDKSINT